MKLLYGEFALFYHEEDGRLCKRRLSSTGLGEAYVSQPQSPEFTAMMERHADTVAVATMQSADDSVNLQQIMTITLGAGVMSAWEALELLEDDVSEAVEVFRALKEAPIEKLDAVGAITIHTAFRTNSTH